MEQIHGHEVMQMMMQSKKAYTRATLLRDIYVRFGPLTRFYTCSASNLSAEGLIDFLEARGKFTPCDAGFQVDADKLCNH